MSKEFDKNRIKRLHALDKLLNTTEVGVSMNQILEYVGERYGIKTDRYAIMRDIKFLREQLGIDIIETYKTLPSNTNVQTKRFKTYRYKNFDASLFNISITDEERDFLSQAMEMIGLKGINNLKLFKKLRLKSDPRTSIISFTKNPIESSIGTVFQNLLDVIKSREVVSIRMRDREPPYNIVSCKVHPWYLREYNRRWYLFGMDLSGTIKHYALDRIVLPIRKIKRDYIAPTSSIDDILKDVIGVSLSDGEAQEILFWVSNKSADFVSRKLIHHSQKEITLDDAIRISSVAKGLIGGRFFKIFCKNNYELRREMLSFGAELIVLIPRDLRSELKTMLKKMSDNYTC